MTASYVYHLFRGYHHRIPQGGRMDEARQQFAPAAHIETPVQRLDVHVNGVRADPEAARNLLLAVAGQQPLERLAVARREIRTRIRSGGGELAAQ